MEHANGYHPVQFTIGKNTVTASAKKWIFCCVNVSMIQYLNKAGLIKLESWLKGQKGTLGPIPLFLLGPILSLMTCQFA